MPETLTGNTKFSVVEGLYNVLSGMADWFNRAITFRSVGVNWA